MAKAYGLFNKGSIIPSILELETELIESESEERERAEELVRNARLSGEKLLEETRKELAGIEEEERKRILESLDARLEELKRDEERILRGLEDTIERNRRRVLDHILKRVIPDWDGTHPGE